MSGFSSEEFRANASALHRRVWKLVRDVFSDWNWEQEKAIKTETGTLFVDIYCNVPIKVAIELHGRQHTKYVPHFHGDIASFKRAVARDKAKKEYLVDKKYNFVEFHTTEKLSDNDIIQRILSKIKGEN